MGLYRAHGRGYGACLPGMSGNLAFTLASRFDRD
jgi:hypothetical protein